MSAKRAKSSDPSKKPSISAMIRCTLTPQGQRNQIKKGKSGRRLQEFDIQIKPEDFDLLTSRQTACPLPLAKQEGVAPRSRARSG